MKVLIVTSDLYPAIGGPFNVISSTVKELLKKKKFSLRIYAFNDGKKKSFFKIFRIINKFEIIHFYGGWSFHHIMVYFIAKFLKKKFIISPMGIFDDWSLNQKKIKKKIALFSYQKKILDDCDHIHATSNKEKKDIQKITSNENISVIPHGISEILDNEKKKEFFINEKRKIIFFSRLHKKKGLDELLEIWSNLKPVNWELHIYGPDYENYKKKIIKFQLECSSIKYFGPVFNEKEKLRLFQIYDAMILPSKSENFGFVILEALRSGLPVITTKFTPWENIKIYDAGWVYDGSKEELKHTLKNIFILDKHTFWFKSKNAKKLFQNYKWKNIINGYLKLYEI